MLRVVIDTNVFVSAALKDKSPPAIAVHQVVRGCILLKSPATEAQLYDVLDRPYLAPLIAPATRAWLHTVLAAAENVEITRRVVLCRDPTDDKFLELAVNGAADFVVSGDRDLLILGNVDGIPIATPAEFVAMIIGRNQQ